MNSSKCARIWTMTHRSLMIRSLGQREDLSTLHRDAVADGREELHVVPLVAEGRDRAERHAELLSAAPSLRGKQKKGKHILHVKIQFSEFFKK